MWRPVTTIPAPDERIGEWAFVVAQETHIRGEGQSGTVFRVRNVRTGQLGAMKMHCGPCTTVDDERFRKERRICEEQPIPGDMPAYYGKGRWKGVDYFVMELVERFDPRGAGVDLIGYFTALTFVYEKLNGRYLHLDGKLANFAVREGRPVLIDFSCAVTLEEGRTMCVRTGTRKYRSPEAREGRPLTVQSDIYTVAAALQGLLADERERRVYGDAISHAMANDERERTKSWAEFRKELKEAEAKYRRSAEKECRLPKFKAVAGAVVGAVGVVALVGYFGTLVEHADDKTKTGEERQAGRTDADVQNGLDAYAVKDFAKAAHFLRQAADSGTCTNGQVFYELAEIYFDGLSVEQDDELAIKYAQRAVELGSTNALPMLRRLEKMNGSSAR